MAKRICRGNPEIKKPATSQQVRAFFRQSYLIKEFTMKVEIKLIPFTEQGTLYMLATKEKTHIPVFRSQFIIFFNIKYKYSPLDGTKGIY
jgi:hypothetical protein